MRKIWFAGIFFVIISFTLIGCSGDSDEVNSNANKNEEANEENGNDVNNTENNEDKNDGENENSDSNNEAVDANAAEADEGGFADEIKPLGVEEVLLDQEKVSQFKEGRDTFIEHDELLYVEHNFITHLLDYELTYDEENTFAEVFKEKGDYAYEPSYKDEGGAIMDLGQVYDEDSDEYKDIPGESAESYKMIEYDGKLYVPERLINVFMDTPLNFERRDRAMEVGLRSEATNIYDFGIDDQYSSSTAEVTQDASDVTIEGKNNEKGVVIRNINSASKFAAILTDYNYSQINGIVHNKSDENTIEVKLQYNEDKTVETIELEPGDTQEFKHDVKGEIVFYISATGPAGTTSEAVVIGELK